MFLKFSRDIKTRKILDWVQNCWQVAKNSPKKWLTKKVKKNEFWARNFCWKFFNGFQPGINFCVWNCCRKSFFPSLLFFVTLKLNTPDETPKGKHLLQLCLRLNLTYISASAFAILYGDVYLYHDTHLHPSKFFFSLCMYHLTHTMSMYLSNTHTLSSSYLYTGNCQHIVWYRLYTTPC